MRRSRHAFALLRAANPVPVTPGARRPRSALEPRSRRRGRPPATRRGSSSASSSHSSASSRRSSNHRTRARRRVSGNWPTISRLTRDSMPGARDFSGWRGSPSRRSAPAARLSPETSRRRCGESIRTTRRGRRRDRSSGWRRRRRALVRAAGSAARSRGSGSPAAPRRPGPRP